MKRNSSFRGVGETYTDTPASGDNGASSDSGGGFWSWLGNTISPVIQSTAPGAINQALNIPSTTVRTPSGTVTTTTTGAAAAAAAKTRNTWLWAGVIGLGGLLIFSVMRRRRRGR